MTYLTDKVREYAKNNVNINYNWYFLEFISDEHLERIFYSAGECQRYPINEEQAIEETIQELEYIIFRIHDSNQFETLFKRMSKLRKEDIEDRIADGWVAGE